MKKIAIITSGLTGIVNISIELATRLKREGFEVIYLCPVDVKSKVETVISNFVLLPSLPIEAYASSSKNVIIQDTYTTYKNELKKVNADYFIIDSELHEFIFIAYGLSIPIRLISQWFTGEQGALYPPLTTAIIPTSKMRVAIAWKKRWLKTYLKKIIMPNNPEVIRRNALKNLAKNNGFPLDKLKNSTFPPIFLNRHIDTYCCTLESLDFPNDKLPSNYQYIGPQISDSRQAFNNTNPESEALKNVILKAKEEHKKIIYCSLSTFKKGDTQFLEKVIEACKNERDWVLIASLGGLITIDNFKSIPKNVHLFSWVQQPYVLSQADLSINHGGINTINECISCQTPMLVYSGKKYDQNGCMARIHYHKLGLQGDKEQDDVATIRQKIITVFDNPNFKERIIQMSHTVKVLKNESIITLLKLKKVNKKELFESEAIA